MKTITRAEKLPNPTDQTEDIYRAACRLFDKNWRIGEEIRLLGVTAQNLSPKQDVPLQLDMFDYETHARKEKLTAVMDSLRDKFGENAVVTLGMIGDDPSTLLRNPKVRGTSLQMDHLKYEPLDGE
jgi:DNA polymerase IV